MNPFVEIVRLRVDPGSAEHIETQVYTLRDGKIVANSVGAVNLPFEITVCPVLKDAVLGGLVHLS